MTVSFTNLPSVLERVTMDLLEQKTPGESKIDCYLDDNHKVVVVMNRAMASHKAPMSSQSSAHKTVRDTAVVTISPPNEELAEITTKYFLSKKIPTSMGAPERLLFDTVTINGKPIIG